MEKAVSEILRGLSRIFLVQVDRCSNLPTIVYHNPYLLYILNLRNCGQFGV